jgi:hypothetical protein
MRRVTLVLCAGPPRDRVFERTVATGAFAFTGALVVWSAVMHIVLWSTYSYRAIPTIGSLFLIQAIAGLAIGIAVVATRRVWASVVAVGYSAATATGFLVTDIHGLFGFHDTWAAPFAEVAFAVELAAVVLGLTAMVVCVVGPSTRDESPVASQSRCHGAVSA